MGWKQRKQTISAERSERLFLYTGCAMTLYALVNSFQWLPLWDNAIGHYGCVAVKVKIYKKLEMLYLVVTIALPALLVPWPFINGRYGNAEGSCWIKSEEDSGCGPARDGIIEQIVLWYLWAFVLLVFTTAVVVVVMVFAVQHGLRAMLTLLGASVRIVGWAGIQIPYSVLLILTITIPSGVVFIIWVVCTTRKKSIHQANEDYLATHAPEKSGPVPSETLFVPHHEDDDITNSYS
eukprot:Em0007g106a